MPTTAVWAKITWESPKPRRIFLVKSLRGAPLEEFEAESEAYAFARAEDNKNIQEHLPIVEAQPAPDEPEGNVPIVMQAVLPDGSNVFFGIDESGDKITPVNRDGGVITPQIRISSPTPR